MSQDNSWIVPESDRGSQEDQSWSVPKDDLQWSVPDGDDQYGAIHPSEEDQEDDTFKPTQGRLGFYNDLSQSLHIFEKSLQGARAYQVPMFNKQGSIMSKSKILEQLNDEIRVREETGARVEDRFNRFGPMSDFNQGRNIFTKSSDEELLTEKERALTDIQSDIDKVFEYQQKLEEFREKHNINTDFLEKQDISTLSALVGEQIPIMVSMLWGGGYIAETGGLYFDMLEEQSKREGRSMVEIIDSGEDNKAMAETFGLLAGSLEYLGLGKLGKIIYNPLKNSVKKSALRVLRDVGGATLKGSLAEGMTEGLQGLTSQTAMSLRFGENMYDLRQVFSEAVAGALVGGLFGGVGTAGTSSINYVTNKIDNATSKTLTEEDLEREGLLSSEETPQASESPSIEGLDSEGKARIFSIDQSYDERIKELYENATEEEKGSVEFQAQIQEIRREQNAAVVEAMSEEMDRIATTNKQAYIEKKERQSEKYSKKVQKSIDKVDKAFETVFGKEEKEKAKQKEETAKEDDKKLKGVVEAVTEVTEEVASDRVARKAEKQKALKAVAHSIAEPIEKLAKDTEEYIEESGRRSQKTTEEIELERAMESVEESMDGKDERELARQERINEEAKEDVKNLQYGLEVIMNEKKRLPNLKEEAKSNGVSIGSIEKAEASLDRAQKKLVSEIKKAKARIKPTEQLKERIAKKEEAAKAKEEKAKKEAKETTKTKTTSKTKATTKTTKKDAVQERKTKKVDVGEQTTSSEKVGKEVQKQPKKKQDSKKQTKEKPTLESTKPKVYQAKNKEDLVKIIRALLKVGKMQANHIATLMDAKIGTMSQRTGATKESLYKKHMKISKTTLENLQKQKANTKTLFQIIGEMGIRQSRNEFLMNMLTRAKVLDKMGKSPEEIRIKTMMQKGTDGKWRLEIDYFKIKDSIISTENIGKTFKLKEAIGEESELFKYYPEFAEIDVEFIYDPNKTFGGRVLRNSNGEVKVILNMFWSTPKGFIISNTGGIEGQEMYIEEKKKSTIYKDFNKSILTESLTHEVQHLVQSKENFAVGGNIRTAANTIFSQLADYLDVIHYLSYKRQIPNHEGRVSTKNEFITAESNLRFNSLFRGQRRAMSPKARKIYEQLYLDDINSRSEEDYTTMVESYNSLNEKIIGIGESKKNLESSLNHYRETGIIADNLSAAIYRFIAGEVEARNASTRSRLSPSQRKVMSIASTEDFSRELQIVIQTDPNDFNMYNIPLFQGTGQIFEKYLPEFIGTGEGATAFGWGFYFTTRRDIARYYARKIGVLMAKVKSLNGINISSIGLENATNELMDSFGISRNNELAYNMLNNVLQEYGEITFGTKQRGVGNIFKDSIDYVMILNDIMSGNSKKYLMLDAKNPESVEMMWKFREVMNLLEKSGIDMDTDSGRPTFPTINGKSAREIFESISEKNRKDYGITMGYVMDAMYSNETIDMTKESKKSVIFDSVADGNFFQASRFVEDNELSEFEAKEIATAAAALRNIKVEYDRKPVIANVTLHKGKNESEYSYLDFFEVPTDSQMKKLRSIPLLSSYINEKMNTEKIYEALVQISRDYYYQTGHVADIEQSVVNFVNDAMQAGFSRADAYKYADILRQSRSSQMFASLAMLESGIDGIRYPTETLSYGGNTSRGGEGNNYVVFDPNAIYVEEMNEQPDLSSMLMQEEDFGLAQGAVQFQKDGSTIIYLLEGANISTPLHEMAHIFEKYLTPSERSKVLEAANHSRWTVETSEYFARGYERFLAEGKAPVSGMASIFKKFKQWMLDIYNGIVGSDIDVQLNDNMRDIYSTMLNQELSEAQKIYERGKNWKKKQKELEEAEAAEKALENEEGVNMTLDKLRKEFPNPEEIGGQYEKSMNSLDSIAKELESNDLYNEDSLFTKKGSIAVRPAKKELPSGKESSLEQLNKILDKLDEIFIGNDIDIKAYIDALRRRTQATIDTYSQGPTKIDYFANTKADWEKAQAKLREIGNKRAKASRRSGFNLTEDQERKYRFEAQELLKNEINPARREAGMKPLTLEQAYAQMYGVDDAITLKETRDPDMLFQKKSASPEKVDALKQKIATLKSLLNPNNLEKTQPNNVVVGKKADLEIADLIRYANKMIAKSRTEALDEFESLDRDRINKWEKAIESEEKRRRATNQPVTADDLFQVELRKESEIEIAHNFFNPSEMTEEQLDHAISIASALRKDGAASLRIRNRQNLALKKRIVATVLNRMIFGRSFFSKSIPIWDPNKTYKRNQIVQFGGELYQVIMDTDSRPNLRNQMWKAAPEFINGKRIGYKTLDGRTTIRKATDKIASAQGLTAWEKFKNSLKSFFLTSQQGLPLMVETLNAISEDNFLEGELQELIADPVIRSTRDRQEIAIRWSKELDNIRKSIFGSLSNSKTKFSEYKRMTPKIKGLPEGEYTAMQLLKKWMEYQEMGLRERLEKSGYTKSVHEQVEKVLDPKLIEYGRRMVYDWFPKRYLELDNVYSKVYGTHLPKVSAYSPIVAYSIEIDGKVDPDAELLAMFGEKNDISSVISSFLKERKGRGPISWTDADNMAMQYIGRMSHFIAWAETIDNLGALIHDKVFKSYVVSRHGIQAYELLKKLFVQLKRGGVEHIPGSDLIYGISSGISAASIGWSKVNIAFKQLTSAPAYISVMNAEDWLANADASIGNYWKEILKLPSIQARLNIGYDLASSELARVQPHEFYLALRGKMISKKTIANIAFGLTKLGDVGAILIGGAPLYKYWKTRYMKEGMSEEKAIDLAELKLLKATDLTQQTSNLYGLSPWERTMIGKVFGMFLQAPRMYYITWMTNALQASRKIRGSKKTTARQLTSNVANVLNFAIFLNLLFYGATKGFQNMLIDDDEPWWDWDNLTHETKYNIYTGFTNGLYFVNAFVNVFVGNYYGVPYSQDATLSPFITIFQDILTDVGKTGSSLAHRFRASESLDDIIDLGETAAEFLFSMLPLVGFNASQIKKQGAIAKDFEWYQDKYGTMGAIMLMIGWTPEQLSPPSRVKPTTSPDKK